MAGKPNRSGRRRYQGAVNIPPLVATLDGVCTFQAGVAAAAARGELAAGIANALVAAGKAVTTALRQKHEESELDELRKLVAESRERAAAGDAYAIAERQHASPAGSSAVTVAPGDLVSDGNGRWKFRKPEKGRKGDPE